MSWLARVSADMACPLGALLDEVGWEQPFGWGVWASPDVVGRVALQADAAPSVMDAGLLTALETIAPGVESVGLGATARNSRRTWARIAGSGFCPMCLVDSPAWRVEWRASLVFGCVRHGVRLVDRCPSCDGVPFVGRVHRGGPLHRSLVAAPALCPNPVRSGREPRCLHPLTTVEAAALSGEEAAALSTVQSVRHVGGGELMGRNLRVRDWSVTLIALASLARAVGVGLAKNTEEDPDERKAHSPDGLTLAPRSTAEAAGLVTAALRHQSPSDVMGELVASAEQSGRHRWRALPVRLGLPELVIDEWGRAIGPRVSFSRRSAFRHSVDAPAGRLPELVSEELAALTMPLLPGTATLTAREFTGLACARLVYGGSWRAAGAQIGMPGDRAVQVADVVSRRVVAPTDLWELIEKIAVQQLNCDIDFDARRTALHHAGINHAVRCLEMARMDGVHPGRTQARARFGAMWMWETVAGGHPYRNAAFDAHVAAGAKPESARERYRQFLDWLPESLAIDLRAADVDVCGEERAWQQ